MIKYFTLYFFVISDEIRRQVTVCGAKFVIVNKENLNKMKQATAGLQHIKVQFIYFIKF